MVGLRIAVIVCEIGREVRESCRDKLCCDVSTRLTLSFFFWSKVGGDRRIKSFTSL